MRGRRDLSNIDQRSAMDCGGRRAVWLDIYLELPMVSRQVVREQPKVSVQCASSGNISDIESANWAMDFLRTVC